MANRYDRVVQENFRGLMIPLINRIMGVRHAEIVTLPRKIQRTLEREMDGLVKVVSHSGDPLLVNLEWQTFNDPKMCVRMLLYHAMSAIVHELPVVGVVMYIGSQKLKMPDSMESGNLKYSYRLIDMAGLNPEFFLESDIPEEIIMAILAGTPDLIRQREIIRKILYKLRLRLRHDENELARKIAQLETLGELRDVQKLIIEEEQKMAVIYNIEKDIRYNQGLEKGIEKGIQKGKVNQRQVIVKNLLMYTSLSPEKIAKVTNSTLEFVIEIKKSIA